MGLSKSNPPTPQVKLLVSSTTGRVPWSLLSWLALGSGAVFLMSVIFSGARLIVDPYSPNWLKTAFPGLVNSFEAAPQTTAEIHAEMKSQAIKSGPAIAWPKVDEPKAWFYPILSKDNKSIQALWVYRVRGDQLQRVEQVSIRPMKESFITTPLVGTASQVASVDSDATLTSVKLMPSQSKAAPWLVLEGRRRYGNTVMRYGQILNYQPHSQRLHRLLNWSSPVAPPQWQTSQQADQQLAIDQTVGLRPSFLLYQLVPNNPPQLQEISLYRSVYETDLSTSLYDKALKLAQGNVWSHSLQMMQSAKNILAQDWSPAAQAQLDLIELHAKHTKAQTEQNLSSQQQHILAYLIDGQWDKALTTLEAHPAIYDSTLKRLEREFDALWRGVTTHLQVHPNDQATQIWGALLVTARQSPEVAEDWLKKKTRSGKTMERLQAVGKPPSVLAAVESGENAPEQEVPQVATDGNALPSTASRYVNLVGQASAIASPGNGWLGAQTLPPPVPGQTWYHIDIQLLQDNSGWGLPPATTTAASFWAESLSLRHQVQIYQGSQPAGSITVHGVKATGSGIALLAIGPALDGPALVTTASLQWIHSLPWQTASVPTTVNTSDNNDAAEPPEQPLPTVGTDTAMFNSLSQQLGFTTQEMVQVYSHLHYASLDLTGDTTAEHLFSISHSLPPELAHISPGKTIIFSTSGDILYSDIEQQQSLVALTESIEQPATLLIERSGRYSVVGF